MRIDSCKTKIIGLSHFPRWLHLHLHPTALDRLALGGSDDDWPKSVTALEDPNPSSKISVANWQHISFSKGKKAQFVSFSKGNRTPTHVQSPTKGPVHARWFGPEAQKTDWGLTWVFAKATPGNNQNYLNKKSLQNRAKSIKPTFARKYAIFRGFYVKS